MSEATVATHKPHQHNIEVRPIERNGVSKVLSKQQFGKLSKSKGITFFTPDFWEVSWETDLTWMGIEWVISVLNKRARKDFQDIFTYHYYDDNEQVRPVFPLEEYIKDCQEFTEGEAKLADLIEDKDELVAMQQEYALVALQDDAVGEDGQYTEDTKATLAKTLELAPKIKALTKQIVALQNKYADRVQKRQAAKAAKESASKTAQAVAA